MSKFTAKKRMEQKNNPLFMQPEGYEWVKSFNEETTYCRNSTKYLIVGTLTPPDGRGVCEKATFPGYFYCGDKNDIYMFLDDAFPERKTKLVNLKKDFRDSKFDPTIKEKIKKELHERKIAFLDVVSEAFVLPGSARDDDIHSYKLDFDSFGKVDFNDNLKVIANSKNAMNALKYILKQNRQKADINLIPQMLLGYGKIYRNKDSLKNKWIRSLQQ